ncbi:Os02g0307133 [Oryza sativa Japonica Group]|uniref:Os02g0307133 protein n=1 Tax=Oryza sativa subsp. japonica TaxID=39947 RepID=A0A0N7KF58_ORYSJ|nr:hypothetical protein DAI22_02g138200 [Oryza sativa Japonica Group]BAS78297.1 Os02g0307133 [Oryza sativa Japonica Group]
MSCCSSSTAYSCSYFSPASAIPVRCFGSHASRPAPPADYRVVGRAEEEAHPRDVVKSSKEMAGFQICAAREHAYMEGFRVGEPELRLGTGRCVLSWTVGMEHNEAWLNQHSLLAMVLKTRPSVSPGEMLEAIVQHTGINESNVRVDVTHTEDFLVLFRMLQDRNLVLHCSHEIFVKGVPTSFKLWSRRSWADSSDLKFFTKISLDGLPAHLWEREVVRNLVNELEGELIESIPANDTRCLGLFAWFKNPNKLPQRLQVEVPKKIGAGGSWRKSSSSSAPPRAPRARPSFTVWRLPPR